MDRTERGTTQLRQQALIADSGEPCAGTYPSTMPQEIEPTRPTPSAARGCLIAFFLTVALALAALIVIALALRLRFPGADPF